MKIRSTIVALLALLWSGDRILSQTITPPAPAAAGAADRRQKIVVFNDDGWSSFMRYPAPMSPEDVVRATVGPLVGTGVKVYQYCPLGGHAVNYGSTFLPRVGATMDTVDAMHVWRIRETLRHLDTLGTDPLHIVAKACRDNGIAIQWSLRMNDAHHTYRRKDGSWYFPELRSTWFDEHKAALLPGGTLDYEHPDVHAYRKRQVQEVLDTYAVDGIDLDFTRSKPWFAPGREKDGMPRMTEFVRDLRAMTRKAGKTLTARFEYDPRACIASGLDVEGMLAEGLFDQITLGGVGDHTPDAACDWWVERAHRTGCKVCPGIEGLLHWLEAPGGGGTGLRAGTDGVRDGHGPPSLAYMRAVASNHYASGADGVSLFNFCCTDGPFPRAALTDLADPRALEFESKQYVAAMWPWDAGAYGQDWKSRFRLAPADKSATYPLRIADDVAAAAKLGIPPQVTLTMDLKGVNRLSDFEVRVNETPVEWNGFLYNHYDHGFWNDTVEFSVPLKALRRGVNTIVLRRVKEAAGFSGDTEVRKLVLEVTYPAGLSPGRIAD